MNHQPFETWNLDRTKLTPDQQTELARHLVTCPECKRMAAAWECVQVEMKTTQSIKAPAGFATRFQNSLAERRRQAHYRQTQKMLGILGISLLVIFLLLAASILARTSPAAWIGSIIRTIVDAPFNLLELRFIAVFWLAKIPPLAWIGASSVITAWIVVFTLTGALTYKRFHHQGELLR